MREPRKGELWEIRYGLENKTVDYVNVVDHKKDPNVKNWRLHDFECSGGKKEIMLVSGICFVKRMLRPDEKVNGKYFKANQKVYDDRLECEVICSTSSKYNCLDCVYNSQVPCTNASVPECRRNFREDGKSCIFLKVNK